MYIYIYVEGKYHPSDWGMLGVSHICQSSSTNGNTISVNLMHWDAQAHFRAVQNRAALVDMDSPPTQTTLATSWPVRSVHSFAFALLQS